MTNAEFFKKELLGIVCDGYSIGIDNVTNKPESCELLGCKNCSLAGRCSEGLREWCHSEYINKPKLTKNEKKFLDILMSDYKYIARDKDRKLYVYCLEKPTKDMERNIWVGESRWIDTDVLNVVFDMVTWKDKEPWLIEDLKKLEVCE